MSRKRTSLYLESDSRTAFENPQQQQTPLTTTKQTNSRPRTHYRGTVANGRFPRCLLSQVYHDVDQTYLKPHREHITGTKVEHVDLRSWEYAIDALMLFSTEGIAIHDLNISGHFMVVDILEFLADSPIIGPSIIRLDMSSSFMDPFLMQNKLRMREAFRALVGIEFLNISNNVDSIDDEAMGLLCSCLPQLSMLNISGCGLLTDNALSTIAESIGRRLDTLNVSHNDRYTFLGINDIIVKCERLLELDLSYCRNVKHLGIVVEQRDGPMMYASRALRRMNVDHCYELSVESCNWICAANPALEQLSMMEIRSLKESAFQGLLHSSMLSMAPLRLLNVAGCTGLGYASIISIADKGRALTEVHLHLRLYKCTPTVPLPPPPLLTVVPLLPFLKSIPSTTPTSTPTFSYHPHPPLPPPPPPVGRLTHRRRLHFCCSRLAPDALPRIGEIKFVRVCWC